MPLQCPRGGCLPYFPCGPAGSLLENILSHSTSDRIGVFFRHPLIVDRGNPGDEVLDDQFNFSNARRRSNSSGYANNLQDFKTKFEFNEPEPVFEESVHGAEDPELTKTDTASTASTSGVSVDDHSAKSN